MSVKPQSVKSPIVFRASKSHHCPVCRGDHGCSATDDGLHFCRHEWCDLPGWRHLGEGRHGFNLFRSTEGDYRVTPNASDPRPAPRRSASEDEHVSWPWLLRKLEAHPEQDGRVSDLAGQLGVSIEWLYQLGCVWLPREAWLGNILQRCTDEFSSWSGAWGFPTRNGNGDIVGMSLRYAGGGKGMVPGSHGGLYYDPEGWVDDGRTIYIPEGATDVSALITMGLRGVGRFSNASSALELAELLRQLDTNIRIVVLGERDQKEDGKWPGMEGARLVAESLSMSLGRTIDVHLPPEGHKDVRAWLQGQQLDEHTGERFVAQLVHVHTYAPPAATPPPDPPVQSPPGKEQKVIGHDLARWKCSRAIQNLRNDRDLCQCPNCKPIILLRKSDWQPQYVDIRCERWSCQGCKYYCRRREELSAEFHWSQSPDLYHGFCRSEEWESVRMRIARAAKKAGTKGEFLRCQGGGGWYWWSNASVGVKTDTKAAMELLAHLLREWTGSKRPIHTSHGWCRVPPEEAGSQQYVRAGTAAQIDIAEVATIADAHQAVPAQSGAPHHPRIQRWLRFLRVGGWTEDIARNFVADLIHGRSKGEESEERPRREKRRRDLDDDG